MTRPAATTSTPPTSGCSASRSRRSSDPGGTRARAHALALVDTVAGPDGAAIPWGRSTGVLADALTVELAALALRDDFRDDRAAAWVRRGIDAFAATTVRFDPDGVADAHRHRDQDGYRGPARRLQLTLDVLGKLAWAGAALRQAPPVAAAPPADTYRRTDRLVRFEAARARGSGCTPHRAGAPSCRSSASPGATTCPCRTTPGRSRRRSTTIWSCGRRSS